MSSYIWAGRRVGTLVTQRPQNEEDGDRYWCDHICHLPASHPHVTKVNTPTHWDYSQFVYECNCMDTTSVRMLSQLLTRGTISVSILSRLWKGLPGFKTRLGEGFFFFFFHSFETSSEAHPGSCHIDIGSSFLGTKLTAHRRLMLILNMCRSILPVSHTSRRGA